MAAAEDLILWGPSGTSFYLLKVGESIVLTGSPDESLSPRLHGYKEDQLGCRSVPASYQGSQNGNAKWECTALKGGNDSNSELFITMGSDPRRSGTIVIQVGQQASPVAVLSPNGGEQFIEGQDMTIRWSGGTDLVQIGLVDERFDANRERLLGWITVSGQPNGSVTWNGEKVCDLMMSTCWAVKALSKGPFRIVAVSKTDLGNLCLGNEPDTCNNDLSDGSFTITTKPGGGPPTDGTVTPRPPPPPPVPPPTSPPAQGSIPPAGYEDEVLTNIAAYKNPFPDTNIKDLSGKAAAELYRRAVIGGFPDGQFKGGRFVNRAEAAKFLLLARYGSVADMKNSGRFPDVLDGQWYTKFIVRAADEGIISGHPSGLFKPADTVNTAEFLKMMALAFNIKARDRHDAPIRAYADVPGNSWFEAYAALAGDFNLFPGRTTYLKPNAPLTRAEVAVAIYQYLSQR